MSKSTRIIKVDALARVEGEGALHVRIKNDKVEEVRFRIFEPPRFFEALLRGRAYSDAPDITARICGICPIAYMMGASHAMEDALGVQVSGPLRDLRRLIYCGEWIESHVLHAAMLHAPDFLGLDDALQIAQADPELVQQALQLKKLGNQILEVVGGRAVHPVNLKVGGFYRAPRKRELLALRGPLAVGDGGRGDDCAQVRRFRFSRFRARLHLRVAAASRMSTPSPRGASSPTGAWISPSMNLPTTSASSMWPIPMPCRGTWARISPTSWAPWHVTTITISNSHRWRGRSRGKPAWDRSA